MDNFCHPKHVNMSILFCSFSYSRLFAFLNAKWIQKCMIGWHETQHWSNLRNIQHGFTFALDLKNRDYLWGSASWFPWRELGSWEYFPEQTWPIPGWNGSASEARPTKWYLRTSWWNRVQVQVIQGGGDPVFSSSSSHKKTDENCLRGLLL